MIELKKKHMAAIMEAGYICMGMRRFADAKAIFEGLSVIVPDSDVPVVALGNVDFCQGKVDSAIKYYNRALKLDAESIFAKVYLGEALFFSGKKAQAIELLKEVAKKDHSGAGEFAKSLMDAIKKGFDPQENKKKKKGVKR